MTDDTDNSDTTVEQLKERIAELESHVYPSRRDVMAAAVGAVGISALTGTASAAPNYGNATGSVGTDSEPLNDVISKQVTAQSLSAGSLVIGGTIYEEDANSPINVSSTTSHTYSVSGTYDDIVILFDGDNVGFDQLQVNGDTGSNYDYVSNADAQTTSATEWTTPRPYNAAFFKLHDIRGDRINLSTPVAGSLTGQTVGGRNTSASGPITQVTFSDSGSTPRSMKARVYGRDLSI